MNITETLSDIAAQYPRAERSTETGEPGSSAHDVSSGGVKKSPRDAEPALYLTSDAAIVAWRDHVLALLTAEKATGFSVIDGPHLDKWRITVADGSYTHRIAEDRYSVTARIGVIVQKEADKPAEAAPVAAEPDARYVYVADDPDAEFVVQADSPPPKPKPAKAAKKKVA